MAFTKRAFGVVPNELQELKQKTRQTNTDMEEVRRRKSSYSLLGLIRPFASAERKMNFLLD